MRIRSCRFRFASSMTNATKREGKVIGVAGAPLAASKLPSAAVPCATFAANDAGVSTEKCEVTCGFPSWRISKSASRKSPTALPCESCTMTRTGTRLTCDSNGTWAVRVVISATGSATGAAAGATAGVSVEAGDEGDDKSAAVGVAAGGAPGAPAPVAGAAATALLADEFPVLALAGAELDVLPLALAASAALFGAAADGAFAPGAGVFLGGAAGGFFLSSDGR